MRPLFRRSCTALITIVSAWLSLGCSSSDTGAPSSPTSNGSAQGGLDPSGGWQSIVASDAYSCGIAKTGLAYCWGVNDRGQLGDSTFTPKTVPTRVAGGHRFVSVSAARYVTCAIATDAAAYCWGAYNDFFNVPARVSQQIQFKAITVGQYEDCGLSVDGIPYCWTTIGGGPATPLPPDAALRMSTISGHDFQFCGVTIAGAVSCWHGNEYGNTLPTTQAIPGGAAITAATAGPFSLIGAYDAHTCAITSDGSAYCWGDNKAGQLGDGSTTEHAAAVKVSGGVRFTSIGAAYDRSCGIGTDSLGYCWGFSPAIATAQSQPTAVHPQLHFAQLSVGRSHTCGVTPSGAGYCWGANGLGQLGTGKTDGTIVVPTRVIDPP